jgi:uncharacterized protein YgiM (DUF1202 family)
MKHKAPILFAIAAVSLALALPAALSAGDAVKIRVTADRVNIRQAAVLTAQAVGRVEKGQVFTVIEKDGEWYLIQLPDGTPGYIHSFTVEEVVEGQAPPAKKPAAAPGSRQIQVTADRANVRKAATLAAPLILTVEKGRLFAIVEKEGEWYLIQLEDGTPGYIHSFTVAEVAGGQASPAVKPVEKPAEAAAPLVAKPVEKPAETPPPAVQTRPAAPPRGPFDSFSMVLLRAGYFLAADSAYTDVYQNGLIYGGELRIGGNKIVGWLEGSYRSEKGELTYTKEPTDVSVLAIEAGALYRFMAGNLNPYAGAGIGYVMFKEENEAIGQVKQNTIGFCLVGGASTFLGKSFIVDARLKYQFCSMKPADFDIQIGGLTAGIGIGFRW